MAGEERGDQGEPWAFVGAAMTDTAPTFWRDLAVTRARAAMGHTGPMTATLPDDWTPEPDHGPHRKMPVRRLRAVCEPCFAAKMRFMAAQPRGSHARTSYERLCGVWEIKP